MKSDSMILREIQDELYDLMVIIHEFCMTNKIEYSLTGGSLLGAVRHNGFIPWDDDLDIMMTRANYNKFCACFKKKGMGGCVFERDQWVFRVRKTHKTSGYVPSIDFFVIDKVPGNKLINKIQIILLRILQGLLRTNEKKGSYSLFYRILIMLSETIGKMLNKERLFCLYDRISQWGRKSNNDKVSIFNDRFKLIGLQYSSLLMDGYTDHIFEKSKFRIITRYDDYLTLQFGDYMKLPPEEDRVPQHIF